jgi:hypothetical protein
VYNSCGEFGLSSTTLPLPYYRIQYYFVQDLSLPSRETKHAIISAAINGLASPSPKLEHRHAGKSLGLGLDESSRLQKSRSLKWRRMEDKRHCLLTRQVSFFWSEVLGHFGSHHDGLLEANFLVLSLLRSRFGHFPDGHFPWRRG